MDTDVLRRRALGIVETERDHRVQEKRAEQGLEWLLEELRLHEVELRLQNEDLRQMQRDLEGARDRYRELFDLAPVGYVTLDPQGRVLEANVRASEMLGVDRYALLNRPLTAFMEQEHSDLFHRHRLEALITRTTQRCELTLAEDVEVLLETVPVGSPDEPTLRTAIVDVGDRKRAERAARERGARLEAVLDTVGDAILTLDGRGNIESANAAASTIFGFEPQELIGRGCELVVLDVGEPRTGVGEVLGRHRDGSIFPLEMHVAEMCWDKHQRFVAVLRDITERKQQEAELRETLTRFRQIAEHVDDVFYVQEATTRRFLYVSPAFEKRFGRPAEAVLAGAFGIIDLVHPDDRGRLEAAFAKLQGGEPFDETYRILLSGGKVRFVRDRAFLVADENRITGIVQDITDERHLEEELRQAQKMEAIGTLSSGIAHDFNNLLMGMIGFLEAGLTKLGRDHPSYGIFARALKATKRGKTLTRQLTSLGSKRPANPKPHAIDTLVAESEALIRRLVGRNVRVNTRLAAPGKRVLADPGEIEQILMNVAKNAGDAMPDGGTLSVETRSSCNQANLDESLLGSGEFVALVVSDTGCGMDSDTKLRIFDPFFTTKEVGKGTGLGLATVFAVVRRLGGHVTVNSEPGQGTKFVFYLPVTEEAPLEVERSLEAPSLHGTVLLVEDDPMVRTTVRSYLDDLGCVTLTAADGTEAARLAERHASSICLVVTDVMLPGNEEGDLGSELRARLPGVPVVFMSAHPRPDLVRMGRIDDRTLLIQKPFDGEDLTRVLNQLSEQPSLSKSI